MKITFYKTDELNGSNYVKVPLRSNAILKTENDDKYCFFWPLLSFLHPFENSHPSRVRHYIPYFNELSIESFDFTNGFRCSAMQRFEKLNNLSKNIFELIFYQDKNKSKQNSDPIEISKNESDSCRPINL